MTRRAWKPSDIQRQEVEILTGCGFTHDQVAVVMRVDIKTLEKHCKAELARGVDSANSKVAARLFSMAVKGDPPAATFFWAKTRMGWRETDRLEHTGKDGAPITITVEQLADKLRRLEGGPAAGEPNP